MLLQALRSAADFLRFYFMPPDFDRDPGYQRECDWADSYEAPASLPGESGRLALDHARARYAEAAQAFDSITARAGDLLKTTGAIAAGLIAFAQAFHLTGGLSVRCAVAALIASMASLLWSRQPLPCAHLPATRGVLDDLPQVQCPEAWLAASLHLATEGLKVVNRWKSAWLTFATWALVAALVCLMPLALG